MELITREEFDRIHSSEGVSDEDFFLMAQLAADVTNLITFGRGGKREEEAKRAMTEMVAYWIARKTVSGQASPKSESVGNYSVTNRDETVLTVRGVSICPAAMVILDSAGLLDHGV